MGRIRVYATLGLVDEAVDVSLQLGDVGLAKALATRAHEIVKSNSAMAAMATSASGSQVVNAGGVDYAGLGAGSPWSSRLTRRLWLQVAKHVVRTVGPPLFA